MNRFARLGAVLFGIAALATYSSKAKAQVTFTYTVMSGGYETNCPQTTYTATGSPAMAAIDVDASAQFEVYNTLGYTKTALTQIYANSGLESGTPPEDDFESGLTYYGVYSQVISALSYGPTNYTADVYASGSVGTGLYVAGAGFYIDDEKTGDNKSYVLGNINISVN